MNKFNHLRVLTDSVKCRELDELCRMYVSGRDKLTRGPMRQRGWVVIPIEIGRPFEQDERIQIVNAMNDRGVAGAYAIATENVSESWQYLELPFTEEGLEEFSKECLNLNYVIVPFDGSCLFLSTSENFKLLAGPKRLVATLLNEKIETAWMDFVNVAKDPAWRGVLKAVVDRYAEFMG